MRGPKPKNVVGECYGRLTIIGDAPKTNTNRRVFVRCTCGTEKEMFLTVLRSGDALSCGCLHREMATTHGESRTKNPLYYAWTNMKSRCNDPKATYYADYGGRGIQVYSEWVESFEAFKEWAETHGYAVGLTLDRKENDKDYTPDNCRWTNRTNQQRNRRSQKGSSSKYVGVSFVQRHQKWIASVKIAGKSTNLGLFSDELAAAIARDSYIVRNQLENFTMNGVL